MTYKDELAGVQRRKSWFERIFGSKETSASGVQKRKSLFTRKDKTVDEIKEKTNTGVIDVPFMGRTIKLSDMDSLENMHRDFYIPPQDVTDMTKVFENCTTLKELNKKEKE